jgi:hypothetical protein
MGIARSTYYDSPEKPVDDTSIVEAMFAICDEFEFYGYRRVGAALRQQGLVINHKKIRRLMRQHDLHPRIRRRFVATTDSSHTAIMMARFSPTWRRTSCRPVPISSGFPTSLTSHCRPDSSTSRLFSMPGHG